MVTGVLLDVHLRLEADMNCERLKNRLVLREAVLSHIDRRRAETGDPNVGTGAEKYILDIELADLERAIGAQESLEHAHIRSRRRTGLNS